MADSDGIKLGKFDPKDVESCASEWEEYKRRFLIHLDAKGLYDADGRRKVGQLLKHMGPEHVITYDSFVWNPEIPGRPAAENVAEVLAVPAENRYDLQLVFTKFDGHFGVHRYRSIKRQEFLSTTRNVKKQSIMNFISELRTKARHCNYGDLEESVIVDMVINRVNDSKCTEKLMELSDEQLTLNNVIRICRQIELTQAHVRALESKNQGESEVHEARHFDRGRSRGRYNGYRGRSRGGTPWKYYTTCVKCCRSHGHGYCKADEEYCGACGQKGHFVKSSLCKVKQQSQANYNHGYTRGRRPFRGYNSGYTRRRSRGRWYGRGRRVHHTEQVQDYPAENYYDEQYDNDKGYDNANDNEMNEMFDMFDTMHCDVHVVDKNGTNDNDFYTNLYVDGKPLEIELDTGAKCNIISLSSLKQLNVGYRLRPSSLHIRGVHGQSEKALGSIVLPCRYKDIVKPIEFQVLNGRNDVNLLGRTECVNLGLIARIHTAAMSGSDTMNIVDKFADVFSDKIGCLPGEYDIKINENVTPVVHPPRPVPCALRDKVKEELSRLERAGIITKVNEPTPWVNSMVVVSKKNSDRVRICIDPSDLNKAILREHYPMNNIDEIATRMSGSKIFSTLDANMGYFQIKLSERSSYLTTFNTPFGRYRNLRMPMGAKCSADKFQQVLVEAFSDIDGVEVYQDDVLIHGKSTKEHNDRLDKVLQKCKEINLKLNKKKCQIGQTEVTYIGHRLTGEGLMPTNERIKSITDMKSPENLEELETVLGMVIYVAKFIPNLSDLTVPLRELRFKDWNWTSKHQIAFDAIKSELTSGRVLRYFDVKKPLLISVDASSKGLGAAAIQEGRVVAYASRALTVTEQRYAQLEKEMLAVVYGLTKFHKLAYGKSDVTIESDHKPLESLLKKPMSATPMRIQRMRLKIEPYTFELVHISGKDIGLADCLSRNFQEKEDDDILMDEELMVCKTDTLAYKWHDRIEDATARDEDMLTLKRVIFHGWPAEKSDLPNAVRPYWDVRDLLSTYNGVIFKGERIVIPRNMRGEILQILHGSHMGIVKTKQRARDLIYWPGLNKQIEEMSSRCEACLENRNKQPKEPMNIHPVPALPWNKVGADLFEHESIHYLLMVDYYSNFIEVIPLHQDTKSLTIIKHFKINISRYGIMETLMTDNGPQFTSSEFAAFTKKYGINHITSSPTHQQSNGLAEEGVKQIKDLMKRCKKSGDDFFLALLDLRNTPRDDEMGSPMQRLHGRRAQTQLPTSDNLLKPATIEPDKVHDRMMHYRRKQKLYYDKGARPLQPIDQQQAIRVWTPNGWKPAEYISPHKSPNSHLIKAGERGAIYRRNRKHLMLTGEQPHMIKPPTLLSPSILPEQVNRRSITPREPATSQTPPKPSTPPIVSKPSTPPPVTPPKIITPPTPPQNPILQPRPGLRQTRTRQPPAWLKDYDCKR